MNYCHLALMYCILFVTSLVLAYGQGQTTPQTPSGAFFTTSDGVKIHYLTLGDKGSWIVLIHGFIDNAERMWFRTGIAAALAKNHRVVALDNRNHGKSDAPQSGASGRPEDVLELMDHLKIDKAHIHGYSMGGGFTGWILAAHPQRLLTAAFGGSGIFEYDEKLRAQAQALDKPLPAPRDDEPAILKRLRAIGQARMRNIPILQIDLAKVKIPVLAINGEFDMPATKTQRMWRELLDFRNVILAGHNHFSAAGFGAPLPPEYIEALVTFINSHDR